MDYIQTLSQLLAIEPEKLSAFNVHAAAATGKENVLQEVANDAARLRQETLSFLELSDDASATQVRAALRRMAEASDTKLSAYLETLPGKNQFERAVYLAKKLATVRSGYFLKKEFIASTLASHRPNNLLEHLGYKSVNELIEKEENLLEAFSALRFIESDEWMHKLFDIAYSNITVNDFEHRPIEVMVLGSKWDDIAKKFVAKKHHNVSHLKEFGVIFINPIAEDTTGNLLRDFSLFMHYFHEVDFYARLFERYSTKENFAEQFKALLRGDVAKLDTVGDNQWLIVQRYLWKEDQNDPRLVRPHVNPESLHWARGERDLSDISRVSAGAIDLSVWHNRDWVGGVFIGESGPEVVSFDLEDTAMSLVSQQEGAKQSFAYHQHEALWNKIFMGHLGGEEELEKRIIEGYNDGFITL